jgi:hypothetical protein
MSIAFENGNRKRGIHHERVSLQVVDCSVGGLSRLRPAPPNVAVGATEIQIAVRRREAQIYDPMAYVHV